MENVKENINVEAKEEIIVSLKDVKEKLHVNGFVVNSYNGDRLLTLDDEGKQVLIQVYRGKILVSFLMKLAGKPLTISQKLTGEEFNTVFDLK